MHKQSQILLKSKNSQFQWLNVSVLASDNGIPPRSSKVELYVQVLDENDNDPEFDFGNSDYGLQVEVQENTPSGTVIANVKATDSDSGENGKITYFLDKRSASTGGGILSSDIIDRFKIHPDTGELTVEERIHIPDLLQDVLGYVQNNFYNNFTFCTN